MVAAKCLGACFFRRTPSSVFVREAPLDGSGTDHLGTQHLDSHSI